MADNRASDRLQKKSNFVGFSLSNLQENSLFWAHFAEKWPVKNGQFCGNFLGMFCWKAFNFALIWWTFFNKKDSNFVIFSKMTSGCLCIYLAISATETPTFYKYCLCKSGDLTGILGDSFGLSYMFVFALFDRKVLFDRDCHFLVATLNT